MMCASTFQFSCSFSGHTPTAPSPYSCLPVQAAPHASFSRYRASASFTVRYRVSSTAVSSGHQHILVCRFPPQIHDIVTSDAGQVGQLCISFGCTILAACAGVVWFGWMFWSSALVGTFSLLKPERESLGTKARAWSGLGSGRGRVRVGARPRVEKVQTSGSGPVTASLLVRHPTLIPVCAGSEP